MRKGVCLALILLLSAQLGVTASAENTVSYSLDVTDSVMTDRLFTVYVCAAADDVSLASSVVNIIYDSSIAEFKSADSDVGETDYAVKGGSVKVVFANHRGVDLIPDTRLMKLTFKGIKSGTFDINIDCTECVDVDYNYMKISSHYGCTLTISGNKVTAVKHSAGAGKSTIIKGDKSHVSTALDTDAESYISAHSGNGFWIPFLCGVSAVVFIILLFAAGVIFGKNTSKNKNPSDNDTSK